MEDSVIKKLLEGTREDITIGLEYLTRKYRGAGSNWVTELKRILDVDRIPNEVFWVAFDFKPYTDE